MANIQISELARKKSKWGALAKCCKAQEPSPVSDLNYYAASDEIWNRRMESLKEWKINQKGGSTGAHTPATAMTTPVVKVRGESVTFLTNCSPSKAGDEMKLFDIEGAEFKRGGEGDDTLRKVAENLRRSDAFKCSLGEERGKTVGVKEGERNDDDKEVDLDNNSEEKADTKIYTNSTYGEESEVCEKALHNVQTNLEAYENLTEIALTPALLPPTQNVKSVVEQSRIPSIMVVGRDWEGEVAGEGRSLSLEDVRGKGVEKSSSRNNDLPTRIQTFEDRVQAKRDPNIVRNFSRQATIRPSATLGTKKDLQNAKKKSDVFLPCSKDTLIPPRVAAAYPAPLKPSGPAKIREGVAKYRESMEPVQDGETVKYVYKKDEHFSIQAHTEVLVSPNTYKVWKEAEASEVACEMDDLYSVDPQEADCALQTLEPQRTQETNHAGMHKIKQMTGKTNPTLRFIGPQKPPTQITRPKQINTSMSQICPNPQKPLKDNTVQTRKANTRKQPPRSQLPNNARLLHTL